MNSDFTFSRYLPSISQLFYAFLIMAVGLTLGKWLTFLFDGSSFVATHTAFFTTTLSFPVSSSTVMAMRRALELVPVCFSASCVTSILVTSLKEKEKIINITDVIQRSWRVGIVLSGLLGGFFLASSALTVIDFTIGMGKNIPFIGPLFTLIYGLIYPIATLISFLLILFSYFIALGPLHAVGLIEQEKILESGLHGDTVTLKGILLSVRDLITESGASVRSVLICGWTFGVIPLFCYQLFLLTTLLPVPIHEGESVAKSLGFLQNVALSISTSVVEAPFLLLSLFISFFFVAKARDASSL